MTNQTHDVIALIPARSGSKGIPNKNIKKLLDKPLIGHTIEQSLKTKGISRVIVSTDSHEIASIAKNYGAEVPFIRPSELALDSTPGIDPVLHCLKMLPDAQTIVLLQPTSPLRNALDIEQCLELYRTLGNSVVSITESIKHPAWMYTLDHNNVMSKFISTDAQRRQDLGKIYCLNGAIYIASRKQLENERTFVNNCTNGYIMPQERAVDIDSSYDWDIAEFLMRKHTVPVK